MFKLHRAAAPALLAAAVLSLAAAPSAFAQPAPTPPPAAKAVPAEVWIADTRRVEFTSKVNGHTYAIDIAYPVAAPPAKGYPVIYVLDGEVYFASVTEAVRVNGNAPQAIVVGIGYPAEDAAWRAPYLAKYAMPPPNMSAMRAGGMALSIARTYDLTTPMDEATLKQMSPPGMKVTTADAGGVDDFLKIIETEIKPRVDDLAAEQGLKIDHADQTLFGHSLGGLAVVEALFTEPNAFRTFVAASPSIWWVNKAVLAKEAGFAAQVKAGKTTPRILITVGGEEQTAPHLPPSMAAMQAQIEAQIKMARMVDNACDLAVRLKALPGAAGYEVADCAVFPHQEHGISVWPAIGRAVAFAFPH